MRGFFQAAVEGIVIHDQGTVLDANPAFASLFGYDLAEVRGMHALDFTAPESHSVVRQNIHSSYEKPYEAVPAIKKHLAFYPTRVDAIEVVS